MVEYLQFENVWLTKHAYEDAEVKYYENLAKAPVTPLADEVAKARQLLIDSRNSFKATEIPHNDVDLGAIKFFEKKMVEFEKTINHLLDRLNKLECRVTTVEQSKPAHLSMHEIKVPATAPVRPEPDDDDDDDVDLFGSDSEEENEAAVKIRAERLAAYNAKKSNKPALIAKSNIILDIKPWDDETDMTKLESEVRKIAGDGLLWGAAKFVPLAYGIYKLQISCVVEDEKVSIDWLQDEIQALEDYVQSVDIVAFNKI